MHTLNLGFPIAVISWEREQGRFRGRHRGSKSALEGAQGSTEGAAKEHKRARGSTIGRCRGAAVGSLKWLHLHRFELPSLLLNKFDSMLTYWSTSRGLVGKPGR